MLSGCVQPSPVVTPAATSSSKPLFASDEEALVAATKAYAAYLRMSDLITSEGGVDPQRIASYVSVRQLSKELDGFSLFRDKKIVTKGSSTFDTVSLQNNELLGDGKGEVTIYVCSDASGVRVMDGQNIDVTPVDRLERQPFELTFQTVSKGQSSLVLARSELWNGSNFCQG